MSWEIKQIREGKDFEVVANTNTYSAGIIEIEQEEIIKRMQETYIPFAYKRGCSYRENCLERAGKTSAEFEEQCLGVGEGCIKAFSKKMEELRHLVPKENL